MGAYRSQQPAPQPGSGRSVTYPQEMQDHPIQILEVRAGGLAVRADGEDRAVTITAALSSRAGQAIHAALSEQLDRRRAELVESAEDILALREQAVLVERFAPLAAAEVSAVLRFTAGELRGCLLNITEYADRVDGEHYLPVELRERLAVLAQVTPVLWDANAAAAAAESSEPLVALRG